MKAREYVKASLILLLVGAFWTAIISAFIWFLFTSSIVSNAFTRFLKYTEYSMTLCLKYRTESLAGIALTWVALSCVEYRSECKYYKLFIIEDVYHSNFKTVFQPRFVGSIISSFAVYILVLFSFSLFTTQRIDVLRTHPVGAIIGTVGVVVFAWSCVHVIVSAKIGFEFESWGASGQSIYDGEDSAKEIARIRNARFINKKRRNWYTSFRCYLLAGAICVLMFVFKADSVSILINAVILYANRCGLFQPMEDYEDNGYWHVIKQDGELYAVVLPNRKFKSDLVIAVRVFYFRLEGDMVGAFLVLNQTRRFSTMPSVKYLRLEFDVTHLFQLSIDSGECSVADVCELVRSCPLHRMRGSAIATHVYDGQQWIKVE